MGYLESLIESVGLPFVFLRYPIRDPVRVPADDFLAAVCGSAIDEDILNAFIGLPENRADCLLQIWRLVERRRHDGNQWLPVHHQA